MGKAWKAAEKEVAEFFHGLRRVRVQYDEKIGDIIHPYYSIEVKWGKQVPKYLNVKVPTRITVGKHTYSAFPSKFISYDEDGIIIKGFEQCRHVPRKKVKFLADAMTQAKRYNPTLLPLVCVKPKRCKGFIVIWQVR